MDYTYLYKHSYQRIDEIQNLLPYDIFISSYVNSQRVQEPADNIQAGQKYGLQQKKKVGIYIYLEKMLRLSKRMKIMLQLQKN